MYDFPDNANDRCGQRSRLAELRAEAGLTQVELAEAAGVSRDTLIRAEHNIGTVRLTSTRRIAAALGTTVDRVFP